MSDGPEQTEQDYVEELMENCGLTPANTMGEFLDALETLQEENKKDEQADLDDCIDWIKDLRLRVIWLEKRLAALDSILDVREKS
jgi:hypothetical protein